MVTLERKFGVTVPLLLQVAEVAAVVVGPVPEAAPVAQRPHPLQEKRRLRERRLLVVLAHLKDSCLPRERVVLAQRLRPQRERVVAEVAARRPLAESHIGRAMPLILREFLSCLASVCSLSTHPRDNRMQRSV
jgi:hypothetical protein